MHKRKESRKIKRKKRLRKHSRGKKNLEEAKKVTIKEDESLPKAKRVSFPYKKNVGYKKMAYQYSERQNYFNLIKEFD